MCWHQRIRQSDTLKEAGTAVNVTNIPLDIHIGQTDALLLEIFSYSLSLVFF
jgi:hypothetical protein